MSSMLPDLDLSYPNVLQRLERHLGQGRTESRAFLAWFLENFYRLEEFSAHDAICDGPDDKGIDGIYIDSNFERIDVLQSKLYQNSSKTLGDTSLKSFVGALVQLQSREGIEQIINATSNQELANLLKDSNLADLIERGYRIRGVFVTNANRDSSADQYLQHQPDLMLYDATKLIASYVPSGSSAPVATPAIFDVSGFDVIDYKTGDARALFAPLLASELTQLDGIASTKLFAWNLRQSLGKTKVNKEISNSIAEQREHKNFLLYHNGLTILCSNIERLPDQITISGYNVVNGCQSLSSLYEKRSLITDELRVLVRLVELAPDSDLARDITRRSNNQNPINARDLQSNSSLQQRIQNEFTREYSNQVFYKIKRGEQSDFPLIIENENAARILLAFDLEQPWLCHQTYKLFDELHTDIFARPVVNAHRILTLYRVYEILIDASSSIDNQLMGRYGLTKFFLLYLLKEALKHDDRGIDFCRTPEKYLLSQDGENRLCQVIQNIVKDLIVDLNAEVKEREDSDNPFDYKRELKGATAVKKIVKDIIPAYQKAVNRGRAAAFGAEWDSTIPTT